MYLCTHNSLQVINKDMDVFKSINVTNTKKMREMHAGLMYVYPFYNTLHACNRLYINIQRI